MQPSVVISYSVYQLYTEFYEILTHLLELLRGVFLATGNVVVRNIVEHVSHCATRRHSVDSNLLLTGILGHDSHKRVNCTLGAGVDGMVGNTEILGCVGGGQDNTTTLIEVAVCLTSNEKLTTGVKAEHTVEFFLYATRIMISDRIFF